MNTNMNALPDGYELPKEFNGEYPLHLAQVVIGDTHTAPEYKVLCASGNYVLIPFAQLVEKPAATP